VDHLLAAPWHVGIGHTETVIIHGLLALFARHVPAANDASLCTPRIRRRFSDRWSSCAERHSDAEYNGQRGRQPDEVFGCHDCFTCTMRVRLRRVSSFRRYQLDLRLMRRSVMLVTFDCISRKKVSLAKKHFRTLSQLLFIKTLSGMEASIIDRLE
jgi:hypothetical protein